MNEEYIKWLEKYAEEKPYFTSDSENDEKVKKLELLFISIDRYASKKTISPFNNGINTYYTINYNDKSYNIGLTEGPETFFYCEKTSEESIIDIKNVLENKGKIETEDIKLKLEILKELLIQLKEDVPEEEIEAKVKKIYKSWNIY